MTRYICIHGHFYQPPRENPWLEAIELQDSAYPYHDWNERITAECYAPNSASRILDGEGRIQRIVNNYARMSFNFGPTLLSWMDEKAPKTYEAILEADRESAKRYGRGSALAQAYNHMILPLADRTDKRTQVIWGIRDFRHRFGRVPEGMWLPETAADTESLEVLAEQGIRFTILAPNQARRVRLKGARSWKDVGGSRIDPSRAYECRLPSKRDIGLFFYDGPISQAVAFERLLHNGEGFANRIKDGFSDKRSWAQLAHIATDGETYGHHHFGGDMALGWAIDHLDRQDDVRLTNYAAYLEENPPTHMVEIFDNSSWSCVHGVERWRSDCGCNSGGHPGWNQAWRGPLRAALDWLRDRLRPQYEEKARELLRDPWSARDEYIDVILDRSTESQERFLSRHAQRPLSADERILVWKLLELQRHAMLMYTSCGWFFDELSGIETVQVIQYAGRSVQLAQELFSDSLEEGFLERLAQAPSNLAEHGDGRRIYEKCVRPAMVDLRKVGAHYAISTLFQSFQREERVYGFTVQREDVRTLQAGRQRMALGKVLVTSVITGESARLSFGVLHLGEHNLTGGVREFQGEEAYQGLLQEAGRAFSSGELPEGVRLLDRHFGDLTYSLKSLFRDEQRHILREVLESSLDEAGAEYRRIYERYAPLMRFLGAVGMPLPRAFRAAAEFVLNTSIRQAVDQAEMDVERIGTLLEEARREDVALDTAGLGFRFQKAVERSMSVFRENPADLERMSRLEAAARLARAAPFTVSLWSVENAYWEMLQSLHPAHLRNADAGDATARAWVERFAELGGVLRIQV